MYRGFRLGRIAGIEINADWSLLIVFFLITFSLATGLLRFWHPEWSIGTSWLTALTAAVLFFASVLAHEMSHALVGRVGGVRIRHLTLFVFGGMAHMENEPPSWKAELGMAIAGPIASILIGIACLAWAIWTVGVVEIEGQAQALQLLSQLGPGSTVLLWLGWINIALGVFNLVPGFPLDGGRVLRSIIWGVTGDHRRATRIASLVGQGFSWLLIVAGFAMLLGATVPVFGRGVLGGLWLILIGWFLNGAAITSYRNLVVLDALNNVPAKRLMRLLPTRLHPSTRLLTLTDKYLMASGQPVFPIEEADRFIGWLAVKDLSRARPDGGWPSETLVSDVMTPADQLLVMGPEQDAADAIQLMRRSDVDHVPVVAHGELLGIVSKDDLNKWLSLRPKPNSLEEIIDTAEPSRR